MHIIFELVFDRLLDCISNNSPPQSNNLSKTGSNHLCMACLYISMHICGYAGMYFVNDISGLKALREARVVQYGSLVDNVLLKHV